MREELPQVIRTRSQINYSYMTIKMTPSRIDKGLIAIPVPLAKWFPERSGTIAVYLDDSPELQTKTFSSYESSTRECRIGGVADWFRKNGITRGDEVVIQVIDEEDSVYRLIPEKRFIVETQRLQQRFDNSESEEEASGKIMMLAEWIQLDKEEVALNEFKRLIDIVPIEDRQYARSRLSRARERVPASLRTLLEDIYKGHCQVCDFWFCKRDNRPYFETHHLNPLGGHHPKNVVVVCGNCHNQFEYTDAHHDLNMDGWLTRVSFNERTYPVNQVAVDMKLEESFKELFI
ncbi:MAG: HNH endonuclease [Chloroflexi bacterium]|nr:HNH endonuclease [Chloroflexota bacterium]